MNSILKKSSVCKSILLKSKIKITLITMALEITAVLNNDVVAGGPDLNPASLGIGNAQIVYGGSNNAAIFNPAVLGAQIEPSGRMQFFPICNSFTAGYWSDKLALTPYKEFFSIGEEGQWQKIVTQIINSSFKVAGETPEETSRKITKKISGGTSVYSDVGISLLELTLGKLAFDVHTSASIQVDLPEAPFLILFSDDNRLKPGANLPLTHLGAQARVLTDISLAYGRPVDLSRITEFFNDLTRGYTDFKYTSYGLGLSVSLGHGYLDLQTTEGGVHYSEDGSKVIIDAKAKLKTSGTGLHDNYKFGMPYEDGFSLAGLGAGINAGILMYGEHSSLSVALRRLGPMVWNNIQEADIHVRTQDLTIARLFDKKKIDLFDTTNGGILPDKHDHLHSCANQFGWQPTRLNIGLGYRFNYKQSDKSFRHALMEYVSTSLEYEQSLAPWPGRSFVPRFSLGAEDGLLWGVMPLRIGFIFGGAEGIASTFGFSLGIRAFCLQAAYKAIGTPFWYPKRGFEVAAGLSTEWRRDRDPDHDGVMDKTDHCPYVPEDIDGFEDTDGCPDFDNDIDGIADSVDKCPNITEDKDGFEDTDGCPEFDNDKDSMVDSIDKCPDVAEDKDGFDDIDGCPEFDNDKDSIADSLDKCPNIAEDKDGFEDTDGCPDFDLDKDSIADSLDKCPDVAEDKDGFEDSDGCPDFDNDKDSIVDTVDKCINVTEDKDGFDDTDGCPDFDNDLDSISDSLDKCPDKPEIYNFVNDSDGCPDKVIHFSPKQKECLDTMLLNIKFSKAGKLNGDVLKTLDSLSVLLKSIASQRYIFCWHDTALTDSVCKSRVDTIADLIVVRGLERSRLAIPDSGCLKFCIQCEQKKGRSLYVKVIETVEEYLAITKKDLERDSSGVVSEKPEIPVSKEAETPVKKE